MPDSSPFEVVAPAGSLDHIRAAISAGADAVYIGVKGVSARPDSWGFDLMEARRASHIVHGEGKRIYYALNASGYAESAMSGVADIAKQITSSDCDALIVGDWGLLKCIRETGIEIPLHGSSLLGVYNIQTVRLLRSLGVLRVILNVNLFPDEIAALVRGCRETSFEVIAYGGTCFHDQWRCRLPHMILNGYYRQGCEYYTYDCYDDSSYRTGIRFSAPDLDLTSVLGYYIELGVTAFKIEGRTRSTDYVTAATTALVQAVSRYPTGDIHER